MIREIISELTGGQFMDWGTFVHTSRRGELV
jgi:hypothetical protein